MMDADAVSIDELIHMRHYVLTKMNSVCGQSNSCVSTLTILINHTYYLPLQNAIISFSAWHSVKKTVVLEWVTEKTGKQVVFHTPTI
jgi:hypothetical protein